MPTPLSSSASAPPSSSPTPSAAPPGWRRRSTPWRRSRAIWAPWARRRAGSGVPTRWRRWRRSPGPTPDHRTGEPRPPVSGEPVTGDVAPSTAPAFDLSRPRRVHVVGAGGAGMSAIASVLAAMGHVVTGSDLKSSLALERLAASGVKVFVGHDATHVGGAEVVAISTAIPDTNP